MVSRVYLSGRVYVCPYQTLSKMLLALSANSRNCSLGLARSMLWNVASFFFFLILLSAQLNTWVGSSRALLDGGQNRVMQLNWGKISLHTITFPHSKANLEKLRNCYRKLKGLKTFEVTLCFLKHSVVWHTFCAINLVFNSWKFSSLIFKP